MRRRRFLAVAGTGALAGCAATRAGTPDPDYDVGMTAVAFRPAEITVEAGETVTWENTSSRAHTVTAYEAGIPADAAFFATGGFEGEAAAREAWREGLAGGLTTGDRFEHRFDVPGTYEYFCIPHERGGMTGRVRVR